MKKLNLNKNISEEYIINNYLRKLNFNKNGTYNFKNDAAFVRFNKNKKIVVTNDSISESIDFFKGDDPKSIANKIVTINLSDLSSMGVMPYAYTLNLILPTYVDDYWLSKFTNELLKLQNKYNFYLLGGDLSKSNRLHISSTFIGLSKTNHVVSQSLMNLNYDIWITGNLGDSYIGLQILKKNINIKNIKIKKYFLKKYYYPKPCMLGYRLSKYVSSMKDVSDGFIGDLNKMLNNKYGAKINFNNIPISSNSIKIIKKGLVEKKNIFNSGDNYKQIIISNSKYRNKIINIAKKDKVKITLVGKTINKKGIFDDSNKTLNIPKEFDHFC